ncbi:MAG: tRNA pseudouridine38-40 synthase [Blastocatellia bacterium]|jgi:tRNA pseudouridine38-40 synthase|nr:tRNA pseudouridine38-40 synthase [Blastocatellia bacterium]
MNFKLIVQYDGTDFHGWQIQPGQRTVQGELTRALSLLDGQGVHVHGSGRTDAGVHAEGQVASVRLQRAFRPENLRAAINGNLERDLRIISVDEVTDDFHARFSAKSKTYVYRILNGPVMSPFWRKYAFHIARDLNVERMISAARQFRGTHDWTAFSAAQSDVVSRIRSVRGIEVLDSEDMFSGSRLIEVRATSEGFLRYMVRSIVGALLAVGLAQIDESDILNAIQTGFRSKFIVTAPAHGLTLVEVHY